MAEEILDRIKRIEKILSLTWRLARVMKRKHNATTKIFNDNFDVCQEVLDRNEHNIDQITETLKGLVGDAAEYDKANKDKGKNVEKVDKNDIDIRKLYI